MPVGVRIIAATGCTHKLATGPAAVLDVAHGRGDLRLLIFFLLLSLPKGKIIRAKTKPQAVKPVIATAGSTAQ